jgi:hypothetical protein
MNAAVGDRVEGQQPPVATLQSAGLLQSRRGLGEVGQCRR